MKLHHFTLFPRKLRGRFLWFFLVLPGVLGISACESRIIPPHYRAELPELPPEWEELLGPPRWRVEWTSPQGDARNLETEASRVSGLDIMVEWTTPVIAYPCWPELDIPAGVFRPAGALFPFDASNNRITLSWKGGLDAWVYLCLRDAGSASEDPNRQPHYFNWPRFRALMESEDIAEEVRLDPWLADWRDVAEQTAASGFDRRRIKPVKTEDLLVVIPQSGVYLGASPFQEPLFWEEEQFVLLPVTEGVDTYVTAQGLLRCTRGSWIWLPREGGD